MKTLWKKVVERRKVWMALSLILVGFHIRALLVPRVVFDRPAWIGCEKSEEREKYMPDLLENWIKPGDSRHRVHLLLGKPDWAHHENENWGFPAANDEYSLGGSYAHINLLHIDYDKHKRVTKAYYRHYSW